MRNQTFSIENVYVKSAFSSVGNKESNGPLGKYFDAKYSDDLMGESCWEKAESTLIKNTLSGALTCAGMTSEDAEIIFSGDLLNQCTASAFGLKAFDIPVFGLYGACSTFAEGLALCAMTIGGGFVKKGAVVTSSHFCSSQKQYRFPLEYGEVRTPTSQWTVTGSGSAVLSSEKSHIKLTSVTAGKICDLGISDANNMGAAMAPAAADTIFAHLKGRGTVPSDYDLIVTGDLASVGSEILYELLREKGVDIEDRHEDCGKLIYDRKTQNVDSGGSGCGCVASVFSGYFYKKLRAGEIKRMLLVATGALMSPSSVLLGETIAGIAHGIEFEFCR